MPIPTYADLMLPLLKLSAEKTWHISDLTTRISDELGLTQKERELRISSDTATLIASRVGWAKTYLKKAGLIIQPRRAQVAISERGMLFLATDPTEITLESLKRYPEFQNFLSNTPKQAKPDATCNKATVTAEFSATPEEIIENAAQVIETDLKEKLLTRILEETPAFFELLILDLLLAMGYGGSRKDAGQHVGGSGDGGVDGLIHEDQLGLDRIYLQAKRFQPENKIGAPQVQGFIGALHGKNAQKGVFITTSSFTTAAREAASHSGSLRVILIDGEALADLLLRFNVGVRVAHQIEVKKIDLDYFSGESTD